VEDLSLHILDIAENSIRAEAKTIEICLSRDRENDLLLIDVRDDGKGMDAEALGRVRNPFFTTKRKKTGLGIPFLAQAAEQTGGSIEVSSATGVGTHIRASFRWSHVDRPAIGNLVQTMMTLIAGHSDLDFCYEEHDGERFFRLDTREIKQDLDDVPLNDPAVLQAVDRLLREGIRMKG
jgi:hypothetical protein